MDQNSQRQGLGGILLADALKQVRQLAEQIGIHAVTVHTLHDQARAFYEKYGFVPLEDDALHLFLPMGTIRKL